MTQVPEAITARLQEIEDNIARAHEQQHKDAAQAAQLFQQAADLKAAIADRRRGIRGWKLQRDALRYAVDAINGRVIYAGTVEAPATEPVVERVAIRHRPPFRVSEVRENTASPKETVYETVRRLGPATPAQITEEAGLHPRAVAGVLGTLKKQGRVIRTEDGLWGPAHQ